MAWAWWLAAPMVVPLLVAVLMWWRGRPRRPEQTAESISSHRDYLQALGSAIGTAGTERATGSGG